MDNRKGNDPQGLVADAEREILEEIAEVTAAEAEGFDAGSRETVNKFAFIALMTVCLGLTWSNVTGGVDPAAEAARIESDALEALELFAGDIEAYRAASGAYPRTFDNPFDDPSWMYERLADDHFRLVIAREDGVLAYDSKEGRAQRERAAREG